METKDWLEIGIIPITLALIVILWRVVQNRSRPLSPLAPQTKKLPENYTYLAPDKSKIRLLPDVNGGGLAHCTLPAGGVSLAVVHKTVEEIWYFLSGQGQVWRKQDT